MAPGDRLPPTDETAQAFEVSEMTVRRAYRMLQDEGVLVRRRGNTGGTFVADTPPRGTVSAIAEYRADAAHVHGLIEQRAVLEAGLAVLAATERDDSELAALRERIDRMRRAVNWAEFREADTEFHDLLASAAHSPAAAAMHHRVAHELYGYFLPYPLEYLRASNEEHDRLIDALTRGDQAAAASIVHAHVVELHDSMYIGLDR